MHVFVVVGGVDESTRAWKPVPTISDTNLTLNTKEVYTMSYEQRAMDLDTLSAPEGHVLTGLKLRNIGGHLNLEIQVTPIKFTTAELMKDQSIWVANDNTPASTNPRKLLPIVIPDIPTRSVLSCDNGENYRVVIVNSNEIWHAAVLGVDQVSQRTNF